MRFETQIIAMGMGMGMGFGHTAIHKAKTVVASLEKQAKYHFGVILSLCAS